MCTSYVCGLLSRCFIVPPSFRPGGMMSPELSIASEWHYTQTDILHTFSYANTFPRCEVTWVTQARQHWHQRVVMGGGVLVREPVLTSVSVLTSPYALNSSLATHTNHAASWQLNLLEMTGHVSTSSGTVLKKYNTATHTDPCTRTYEQFVFFGQFQEQLVRPCHQG